MGPLQATYWLPERAAGEHMAKPERFKRIEQHNIKITRQSPVLETVVKHNDLAGELSDRPFGRGYSVGILHVWHIWKRLPEFKRLVVVGIPTGSVPATDDCHAKVSML
jgi:hypothetical protein